MENNEQQEIPFQRNYNPDYRINSLPEKFDILDKRVDSLELRLTLAEKDVQNITKKLDKIDSNTSKIIWLIISTVGLAILNIAMKGSIL